MTPDPRRTLPSVDRLLQADGVRDLLATAPRNLVVAAVRDALAPARVPRAAGAAARGPVPEDWSEEIREPVARRSSPSLHPVLNATGVVLHTNLGRAPLAASAVAAMVAVAGGYSATEFD